MAAGDAGERGAEQAALLGGLERLLALEVVDAEGAVRAALELVVDVLDADLADLLSLRDERLDAEPRGGDAGGGDDAASASSPDEDELDATPAAVGDRAGVAVGGSFDRAGLRASAAGHVRAELPGILRVLGFASFVLAPVWVGGGYRGELVAATALPDRFGAAQASFLEAVARWLGQAIHRTELLAEVARHSHRDDRRDASMAAWSGLTPRQREVAALIAGGLTNEQIARRLVLTSGTVGNHVQSILRRLGAHSRVEVATLAAEVGLYRDGAARRRR